MTPMAAEDWSLTYTRLSRMRERSAACCLERREEEEEEEEEKKRVSD